MCFGNSIGQPERYAKSMHRAVKGLIKVGVKVTHRGGRWYVHVASAFPLSRYYQAVFG